MNIAQGNLWKPLKISLFLGDAPFVLQNTDDIKLRWSVGLPTANTEITEVSPTILNATNGQLFYEFVAGETDTPGKYCAQVTIIRDGKPLTFPDDGSYFRWTVIPRF